MKNTLRICYNITHADDADGCACPTLLSTVNMILNEKTDTMPVTIVDTVHNGDPSMRCAVEKFVDFCHFITGWDRFPIESHLLWDIMEEDCFDPDAFYDISTINKLCGTDIKNVELCLYITDIALSHVFDDDLIGALSLCKQANIDMKIYHIDHHPTNPRFNKPVDEKWEGKFDCLVQPKTSFPEFQTGKDFRQRSAAYLLFVVLMEDYASVIRKGVAQLLERFAYEVSEADTYEFKNPSPENVLSGLWRMDVPDSYSLYYKSFGFVDLYNMCLKSLKDRIDVINRWHSSDVDYFKHVEENELDKIRYGVGFPDNSSASQYDGMQHIIRILNTIREKEFENVVRKAKPYSIVYNEKEYHGFLLYNAEASYNGNRILEEAANTSNNVDFVMILYVPSLLVSLRSISDDVNVSKMAEAMGGGGHPRAAGFSISEKPELFMEIMSGTPLKI